MQFGILLCSFTVLADLASSRYCIPMDSPRPILPAELQFFNKGTGRGKSQSHLETCWLWRDCLPLTIVTSFPLANFPQNLLALTSKYYFTVPLVVIFTKFDGQIATQFVNLTDGKDEDRWERARDIAESTFQKVYLPQVLYAKYCPKAYVRLEGENDEDFF